ncbi:MAG: hypothetical protein GF350_12090 [Chitinivibrionales bacterium]|nr:hypothetical protein [Chitinivibrionales bacterium]
MKHLLFVCLSAAVSLSTAWDLVEKNNHITDIPTVEDFMPLNVTSVQNTLHEILYPPDDPQCSFR